MIPENKLNPLKKALYVLGFHDTGRLSPGLAGGKGTNLGQLSRIKGIHVPAGFCVTTAAYKKLTGNNLELNSLLDELTALKAEEFESIGNLCEKIRIAIESVPIPGDITAEIARYLADFDENDAFAVRSSATAEDLPSASFAGQQDTYLNIIGKEAVLKHISKCWASLFTTRAAVYRLQNGFDHRKVQLAVVVQQMVFPQAAGILFTADPLTGNRKVSSIDAGFGLGEAMVSGLVTADGYKACKDKIIEKTIPAKKLAVYGLKEGGTSVQEVGHIHQNEQVLPNGHIFQLEQLGRKIESHFGCPQDIEWCLTDDKFFILQSRPITTLYPVPEVNDGENHVFVSVGHQQMMTDAMKPLGLSLWQHMAFRPMFKAGGRLFVDVTKQLASPVSRNMLLKMMEEHDPLIHDAILTILKRGDFIKLQPDEPSGSGAIKNHAGKSSQEILANIENDPAIVAGLIEQSETSVAALKQTIRTKSGADLFDFILEDIQQLKKQLFAPPGAAVIMAAIDASTWLNENMQAWLGEKNAAGTLSQSAPNNITAEMGLELLDVADAIRPYPQVIDYLQQVKEKDFLDTLYEFNGGTESREAIEAFLSKYGMRCVGEIDITKARWTENPAALIPILLSNLNNFEPGAGSRKFERGRQEALKKEAVILNKLKQLPGGAEKAMETIQMIRLLRNFIGYREYPKYGIANRFFVYKQALLKEAQKLVRCGAIHQKEDIYFMTFEEFREAVRTNKPDYQLITQRKEEQRLFEKLNPPRVITSDGEIITARYKRENLPFGAIIGLPVSTGVVEGRARVILRIEDAHLEEGDILVTVFTDPSWTPLFVSLKGLVTEVGGLMTHGAVIAREYGLPAIVGAEHATRLITDGQRIRVNGTDGYAELL